MPARPTVLVLSQSDIGYARQIVRGVLAYAVAHDRWSVRCGAVPRPEMLETLNPGDDGGAVCFFPSEALERAVLKFYRAPVVNVSFNRPNSLLPRVLADNHEVGRRAARHLLERGFRRFAFAGNLGHGFAKWRLEGFTDELTGAGYDCDIHSAQPKAMPQWLSQSAKPVGIFTSGDGKARQIADFCHDLDIGVPEQVAVIGVDNDTFICESSYVPLTSVDTRGYDVGHRAAALLDELMQGAMPPDEPIIVPCGEVVTRRSTDTVAVDDPDLIFAMRYIREHACDPMRVDDMLEHMTLARRTLEKRFKRTFGRTLHNEIRRIQIERAKALLAETEMLVPEVAGAAGFCDRKLFTKAFGEATGMPPGEYRARNRRR